MDYLLLFRKLVINNNTFYQLYDIKEKEGFDITDEFGDFNNRHNKDYFYVNVTKGQLDSYEKVKYYVYRETKKKFEAIVDSDILSSVLGEFKRVFNDFNFLPVEDTIGSLESDIKKEVMFQDDAVIETVRTIFMNQDILNSNIPEHQKDVLKDNIILYGPKGNGKNSIVEALKKHISIPYADISLNPDPMTNIKNVIQQLLINSNNGDISNGIVFVRDNFDDLANFSEELQANPYLPLVDLQGKEVFFGEEQTRVNFKRFTFITLINTNTLEDVSELGYQITLLGGNNNLLLVEPLNIEQKKQILKKSPNSRLAIYREFLKKNGKNLRVSKDFVDYLVRNTEVFKEGMNPINDVIDHIIKNEWYNESNNINLTISKARELLEPLKEEVDSSDDFELPKRVEKKSLGLNDLVEQVKMSICSQDDQIKRILFTILNNNKIANEKNLDNPKRYIKNILLRGGSGTGKTAILETIAKLLDIPFYAADATRYTEAGYKGDDVENMLIDLYHAAGDNLEKAERGILNIDEIDKKANGDNGVDVSRGAVLNGLLKIIEGSKLPLSVGKGTSEQHIMFDTSRLTVICSGAFEGVEKIRDKRLGVSKTVGFGSSSTCKENEDPNIIDEDYIKYGMIRQFMARLGVIVNLNELQPKDLKNIMINSNLSELIVQKKLYSLNNIDLVYNDDFYDELSVHAYNKKIGARGIEKAFQDVLTSIKIMDIDPSIYEKIIFNKECINDPSKIILVERSHVKVKKM